MPHRFDASASPTIRVTVLGSGTSTGVPLIGCSCPVCLSSEPRNKRLRASIAIELISDTGAVRTILIDTTPDLRMQALRAPLKRVDAVLMTHTHADHIFGMDDLRQFNYRQRDPIPVYGTASTLATLRQVFSYCFTEGQMGGGKPRLELQEIEASLETPFEVCGVSVRPLPVWHGNLPVLGYKFGESFAYVTDVSRIPPETMEALRNLDILILDAVRHEPHATHFSLPEALGTLRELVPRRAFLTHLSHDFDHYATTAALPDGVSLAYDGLTFEVTGSGK